MKVDAGPRPGRKGAIPLNALSPAKSTPSKKHPRPVAHARERVLPCVSGAGTARAPNHRDAHKIRDRRTRHSVYCHSRACLASFSRCLALVPPSQNPRTSHRRIILVNFMGLDKVHRRRSYRAFHALVRYVSFCLLLSFVHANVT